MINGRRGDVQGALDEYHLEKGLKSSFEVSNRIKMSKIEVSPNPTLVSDSPEQKKALCEDTSALERLIGMLEQVLLQGPGYAQAPKKPYTINRLRGVEGLSDMPCSICNDSSHSALTHCQQNRLCFLCHLPGHSRRDYPEDRRPTLHGKQGN